MKKIYLSFLLMIFFSPASYAGSFSSDSAINQLSPEQLKILKEKRRKADKHRPAINAIRDKLIRIQSENSNLYKEFTGKDYQKYNLDKKKTDGNQQLNKLQTLATKITLQKELLRQKILQREITKKRRQEEEKVKMMSLEIAREKYKAQEKRRQQELKKEQQRQKAEQQRQKAEQQKKKQEQQKKQSNGKVK